MVSPAAIRVVAVADSGIVRAGLRALLSDAGDIEMVGEARQMAEAVLLARELRADVALVDVRDPQRLDVGQVGDLCGRGSSCQVIILTARRDEQTILDLIMDGAAGYLFEDVRAEELCEAIRTVHLGGSPVDPQMAAMIAARIRARSRDDASPWSPLTVDEYDVLVRIVRGETNRQISRALHLEDKIVKQRVSSILRKISAKNRVAAAAWWARQQQEPAQRG